MSTVYNPEAEIIHQIERLELEGRDIFRRIEHVRNESDKRALNKQLTEIKAELAFLQSRVP